MIEYRLEGVEGAEPAALCPERWEVEVSLDAFKTHMRGGRVILRSKAPELVEQEFYGMMLAHRAVRALMNEAALRQNPGPDRGCEGASPQVAWPDRVESPAHHPSKSLAQTVLG